MASVRLIPVRSRTRQVNGPAASGGASGAETMATTLDSPGLSSSKSWPTIDHSLSMARGYG